MTSIKFYPSVVAAVIASFIITFQAQAYADEDLLKEILSASSKFEKAVNVRNFKIAKEQLDILFPLMKKEIKESKKELHAMEKSNEVESLNDMKGSYDRKIEIEASLLQISSGSSASLRVQANDALILVQEYVKMFDEANVLLSSNN